MLLYAMSLEDAKKMAEAYVQYAWRRCFERRIAQQQEYIRECRRRRPPRMQQKATRRLARSEETHEKGVRGLAKKQVPYRRRTSRRWMRRPNSTELLNTAQVEIAGIQAKIKAIQDRN